MSSFCERDADFPGGIDKFYLMANEQNHCKVPEIGEDAAAIETVRSFLPRFPAGIADGYGMKPAVHYGPFAGAELHITVQVE